jgi:hypothetical protein
MSEIVVTPQVAVALVVAFLGLVFGFGRMLLNQFEKRMAERFDAQDELRDARLRSIENKQAEEKVRIDTLTGLVQHLTVSLPTEYVRREDWIRMSSTIDHKLDKVGEIVTQLKLIRDR